MKATVWFFNAKKWYPHFSKIWNFEIQLDFNPEYRKIDIFIRKLTDRWSFSTKSNIKYRIIEILDYWSMVPLNIKNSIFFQNHIVASTPIIFRQHMMFTISPKYFAFFEIKLPVIQTYYIKSTVVLLKCSTWAHLFWYFY